MVCVSRRIGGFTTTTKNVSNFYLDCDCQDPTEKIFSSENCGNYFAYIDKKGKMTKNEPKFAFLGHHSICNVKTNSTIGAKFTEEIIHVVDLTLA